MKTVTTELLDDMLESVDAIAQNRGWSLEVALRNVINAGIAVLRTQDQVKNLDGLSDSQKVEQLIRQLIDADMSYAALRFQNFTLTRDNQTLELNLGGFRGENENLKGFVQGLKVEIARLQAELDRLKNGSGVRTVVG